MNLHSASITDSLGRTDKKEGIKQVTLLREKYGDDFYMEDRARKHRYFYLLGGKQVKKQMLKKQPSIRFIYLMPYQASFLHLG